MIVLLVRGGGLLREKTDVRKDPGFEMACTRPEARQGCIKNITWEGLSRDHLPMAWGTHSTLGRVRFLSLHFQGASKERLAEFAVRFLASVADMSSG